jgi:hypothetical protein
MLWMLWGAFEYSPDVMMVDELRVYPTRIRCFQKGSCHLTTDGAISELHAFAARLGMRREWFQEHPYAPHYDLTPERRARALVLGAVLVPAREQAAQRRARGIGIGLQTLAGAASSRALAATGVSSPPFPPTEIS